LSGVAIKSNQVVTVSYDAPVDNPLNGNAAMQDTTGNDMSSFNDLAAINNSTVAPDLRAPIVTAAGVNAVGTLLTLTYDETLSATTAPTTAYTVLVDNVSYVVTGSTVSGATVQLTLGTAVRLGQVVTITYAAPTNDPDAANLAIQDASGNDVVALNAMNVTNMSSAGPDTVRPTLSTVVGTGTTVTLSFNETLGLVTAPASSYTVFIGNDPVEVTAVSVSGANVILTLASSITAGQKVSVSYLAPASNTATSNSAIQDFAGNDAISFGNSDQGTSAGWSWSGASANNTGCVGSRFANSTRQRLLPNGVTYSIGVTGPYLCIWEQTESLSARGGRDGDFTATGLISDPGVKFSSLEPLTTSGDTNCVLATYQPGLSSCSDRGFVTMTFSQPTKNPVISFAGWGGADGGAKSWSELDLVTPGVTITRLSGTNMQITNGTHIGVVEPSPGTRCSNAIPAGCGSIQVNGTVTEVKFALTYNSNGNGWGNEDQWNMVASVVEDFGQLPIGYDSPVASHVVGNLRMGSVVTADNLTTLYGTTNADAVASGSSIPATDDGVASWGSLNASDAGSTYSVAVALSNVESTAFLCGWIDFNRDGVMAYSERACATNPTVGATSANLSWTVPANIVSGRTYIRLRLSYDSIPLPTGKVASGEVEDYSLMVGAASVPNASNDTSLNGQDVNQIISPLTNDNFEAGFPAVNSTLLLCGYGSGPFTCNKMTLEVPDQGTYQVNENGTVTFDPLPNYVGTATPVQYCPDENCPNKRHAWIRIFFSSISSVVWGRPNSSELQCNYGVCNWWALHG
jgi:uncharacterized repeat protein (TIGR02059 family)